MLRSQRTPKDFRQPNIKADRELYRDPAYAPAFTNVPLRIEELAVLHQHAADLRFGLEPFEPLLDRGVLRRRGRRAGQRQRDGGGE